MDESPDSAARTLPPNAAGLLAEPEANRRNGKRAVAAVFGSPYSALALTPSDAYLAPPVVRQALSRYATYDLTTDVELGHDCILDMGDTAVFDLDWHHAYQRMRDHAAATYGHNLFTVGLGGDHSVTWPHVAAFAGQHRRIGIIQLDAHHDVRPYANGAGVSNGCPIRGLIDAGVVRGRDVEQIGILPFSNAAALGAWCDTHGISRVSAEQLRQRGAGPTVRAALRRLSGCDAIYLTVDIDVLDRAFAPGTAAAVPGGITPAELLTMVRTAVEDPRTGAMDIVEFDPARDVQDITAYACAQVLLAGVATAAARTPAAITREVRT